MLGWEICLMHKLEYCQENKSVKWKVYIVHEASGCLCKPCHPMLWLFGETQTPDTKDGESVNRLMSRLDTSLLSSVPQSLSHLHMTATLPL